MIGGNSQNNKVNLDEISFVIVYDRFTKPAAISLSNQLAKKYKCVIWDKKHFLAEEQRIVNRANIIIFDNDLINENFANPSLKGNAIVAGMDCLREGNRIGIVYNEATAPKKLSDILKDNWGKYTLGVIGPILLIGGIPGAAIISWLLTIKQKKKIKFKLYMDAVDVLVKSKLQDILNG